jgi:hypothetical protein
MWGEDAMKKKVMALLCADLHLSLTPPIARSSEPDWLAAQMRPLNQLRELKDKHQCPVFYAGDVFDRWGPPVELVNWAIESLPCGYAVPGQHDLPMHNLCDIKRSAYWTLVQAGVIRDISGVGGEGAATDAIGGLRLRTLGFAWGRKVHELEGREDYPDDDSVYVALIHAYIWKQGTSYENAPKESRYHHWKDRLRGYDVAVFGDNHIHFSQQVGSCIVWNCGCLIPRKSDERELRPGVGLLWSNGDVDIHRLDTSEDKWIDVLPEQEARELPGVEKFIEGLEGLSTDSLDFRDVVRRYISDNKVRSGVKEILLEGLEQ